MGYRQFGRVVKASVSGADLSEVVGSNPTAVIFAIRTRYFGSNYLRRIHIRQDAIN